MLKKILFLFVLLINNSVFLFSFNRIDYQRKFELLQRQFELMKNKVKKDNLLRVEQKDVELINIVKEYAELVKQMYSVNQIYLFGSYAKGNAGEESDIDVAIVLDKIGDDYLEQCTKLFQLRRKIDLRIEPVLLELNNDVSGFLHEIRTNGLQIYQS